MPDLIVIVPTRGRPTGARLLAQAVTGLSTADTRVVFAVDNDDPCLRDYHLLLPAYPGVSVQTCGPWQSMVSKLNAVAVQLATWPQPPYAIGFCGDDHRPRTRGWDTALLDALRAMGTGVVYGDDLYQRERLCTAWAMTSDIVRALGRMIPAPVGHMYCDNAVMDLAHTADCLRYLPGVIVEHCHPLAGKAEWDPGYVRVNADTQYQTDRRAYLAWHATQLGTDADTVRALRREVVS